MCNPRKNVCCPRAASHQPPWASREGHRHSGPPPLSVVGSQAVVSGGRLLRTAQTCWDCIVHPQPGLRGSRPAYPTMTSDHRALFVGGTQGMAACRYAQTPITITKKIRLRKELTQAMHSLFRSLSTASRAPACCVQLQNGPGKPWFGRGPPSCVEEHCAAAPCRNGTDCLPSSRGTPSRYR